MTKMFKSVGETWNPVSGCLHNCKYCYARIYANRNKLRDLYLSNKNICLPVFSPYGMKGDDYDPYRDPFYPRYWPRRLKKTFKPGILVFVVDMGDLFGDWVPTEWIQAIIDHIEKFPRTTFLFLTKNPERYRDFAFSDNAILGTTLESNRDYEVTWAGSPAIRQLALSVCSHPRKFVSIEPIMDFDLKEFTHWIEQVKPELIEVGADNYGSGLPEPPGPKIRALLENLRGICPTVIEKDGLGRLLG